MSASARTHSMHPSQLAMSSHALREEPEHVPKEDLIAQCEDELLTQVLSDMKDPWVTKLQTHDSLYSPDEDELTKEER
jgi:hypothetical protein